MSLMGQGAVAMWWHIRDDKVAEFGDWHSHEHFPERLHIPGFNRGSRWASVSDPGVYFVLYELEQYEVLSSPGYLERLNNPTPWSRQMMPHHQGMVRSQCRITHSMGGGIAAWMATIRVSPDVDKSDALRATISAALAPLPTQPGLTAAHLLVTDTPKMLSSTTEQQIRGADQAADWIVLVSGYDANAISAVTTGVLSASSLVAAGARQGIIAGLYRLDFAMTRDDAASDSLSL